MHTSHYKDSVRGFGYKYIQADPNDSLPDP